MTEATEVLAALGAVDGSMALGFAMHVHAVGSIADSAEYPAEARNRVYQAIVADGALCNNAATEEGGGSPARGAIPGTTATPMASGWRLRGEKTWTSWLPALRYAFVSARIVEAATEPDASERISVPAPLVGSFLVDLEADGIDRRPAFDALGMRASASGRLVLDDGPVAAEALIACRRAGQPDPRGSALQPGSRWLSRRPTSGWARGPRRRRSLGARSPARRWRDGGRRDPERAASPRPP
jgi:alkylation response protein AidB-like acyl-CoA dehydrogenase